MTINQLDSPLRITWDLHSPVSAMSDAAAIAVAKRLVEAGVFFVTLDVRPLAHPAWHSILAILQAGGIKVQATFSGHADEWIRTAPECPRCDLLVDAGAFLRCGDETEFSALSACIEKLRERGGNPSLMLVPDRARLGLVPLLLDFCRKLKIGRFKLPNTRIDASFDSDPQQLDLPGPDDVDRLRAAVSDPETLRSTVAMEVHDLFLWEIFFPGERESGRAEYGGCQAGNSLGHVDACGMLRPCSSWPQILGSLLDESLEALWQSTGRHQVRDEVADAPFGCVGCRDFPICFGGCRGLTRTLFPKGHGRDLLCREKR